MKRAPWTFFLSDSGRMAQWFAFWNSLPVSLRKTDTAAQVWLSEVFYQWYILELEWQEELTIEVEEAKNKGH